MYKEGMRRWREVYDDWHEGRNERSARKGGKKARRRGR